MFKYFADILSKLSLGQRLIALCIMLLTIVIIYLGPKLITAITYDDTELRTKIIELKSDNAELTTYVNNTNDIIRSNQKECTDQQLQREKEFLNQITELEKLVTQVNKFRNLDRKLAYTKMYSGVPDTSDKFSLKSTASYDEEEYDPILKQVTKIKTGIKKEITEKKK